MAKKEEKKKEKEEKEEEKEEKTIVRIAGTDIPGKSSLVHGLTFIKGIGWSFSNAICQALKLEKTRKISGLEKEEIEAIESFLKKPKLPAFLLGRKERETGIATHFIGPELELRKEFDIRKLKKIRSYRGWRHALGLPVRGQRTKSHFRHGRAVGVKRKKEKIMKAK